MNVTELFRSARILSSDNQAQMNQQTNINIQYPSVSPYIAPEVNEREVELEDIDKLGIQEKDEQIQLLQLLLNIYQKNPLIINQYVVCSQNDLEELIKLIAKSEKCVITIDEDSICNCVCGPHKYSKISSILVYKNNSAYDFKYEYNEQYNFLKLNKISMHFVV